VSDWNEANEYIAGGEDGLVGLHLCRAMEYTYFHAALSIEHMETITHLSNE